MTWLNEFMSAHAWWVVVVVLGLAGLCSWLASQFPPDED